jgi:hypothetical protein
VPAGAWFLFQDYLDFRCYWISFVLERMGDVFDQSFRADSTYAFSLRRPLDPAEIHKRIPDDPRQLGAGEADAVFDALAERAFHREDRRARITHILQKASARRARGEATGARALLDGLDRARWASGYGDLLTQARRKLS